jgi:hypothetical protein
MFCAKTIDTPGPPILETSRDYKHTISTTVVHVHSFLRYLRSRRLRNLHFSLIPPPDGLRCPTPFAIGPPRYFSLSTVTLSGVTFETLGYASNFEVRFTGLHFISRSPIYGVAFGFFNFLEFDLFMDLHRVYFLLGHNYFFP